MLFYGDVTINNHTVNLTGPRCGANPSSDRTALSWYNAILFVTAVTGLLVICSLYIMVARTIYKQHKFRRRHSSGTSAFTRSERDSMDWDPPSESGNVPTRQKAMRDSLDLDSPFLSDPPTSPGNEESIPLQNSAFFSVPLTPTEKILSSFSEFQKKLLNRRFQMCGSISELIGVLGCSCR